MSSSEPTGYEHLPDDISQVDQSKMTEMDWVLLMKKQNDRFYSAPGHKYGTSFTPRSTDVFVTTYPKCGTTWMQNICHQLRSGGDISFNEISEIVPWDIFLYDYGVDTNADQVASPRIFKSHESYVTIAKNPESPPKYIHVLRTPKDAVLSFFYYMPAFFGIPPGKISKKTFTEILFFKGASDHGNIMDFFMAWYNVKDELKDNILWVFYEDLVEDLEHEIKRVAKFMDIPLSDELLQKVKNNSTFEFMKAHSSQFNLTYIFDTVRSRLGLDNTESRPLELVGGRAIGEKVESKEERGLPKESLDLIDQRWAETITAATGLADYEAFRQYIKKNYQ